MRWPWQPMVRDRPDIRPSEELRALSEETRQLAARLMQMSAQLRRQEGLPK